MKVKDLPTGYNALHKNIDWKADVITVAMVPCYNGTSYTTMLFCVSQAEENGGETYCSFNFAKDCSKCRIKVSKPKDHKISVLIKNYEKDIE